MSPTARLSRAAIALGFITLLGTIGYRLIEGASLADSLYMVLMTVSTVGFAEVFPLGPGGRFLTGVLIVVGVGTALYTAGVALEVAVVQVTDRGRKARMQREIDRLTAHQIVCGFGRVGHAAWEDILEHRADVVVIESDPDAAERARAEGALVVEGDATHNDVLFAAGIDRAAGLIACVSHDSDNLVIVLSARALNLTLPVVARANDMEAEEKIRLAGADRVVAPQRVGARRMAAMALQPGLADFVDLVIRGQHVEFRVERVTVAAGSPLEGNSLSGAGVRQHSGAMVLAVERPNVGVEVNPDAQTPIPQGSVLVAIGTAPQIAALNALGGEV